VCCRALGPTIDELATEYSGRVKIGKLNTENNQETPVKYNVQAIPTILLFKEGQVVQKFVGLTAKKDFQAVDRARSRYSPYSVSSPAVKFDRIHLYVESGPPRTSSRTCNSGFEKKRRPTIRTTATSCTLSHSRAEEVSFLPIEVIS
jgi:thiol-disulfide isomerase/thioredoxin